MLASNRTIRSSLIGLLILAAFVLAAGKRGADRSGRERAATPLHPASKSERRPCERETLAFAQNEKIRSLSARQVRDALPDAAGRLALLPGTLTDRDYALFARFGALEGEAALDELLSRYGAGTLAAEAMTHAIVGWLEGDRDAALAAFRELVGQEGIPGLPRGMEWKGSQILSAFG